MKHISFILACLVLCLSSCTMNDNNQEDQYYFLFATPLKNHDIWIQTKKGFMDACTKYNIVCEWEGPLIIDVNEMEQVIQTGVLKGVDAIITQGVISNEVVDYLNECQIPVVFVDSDVKAGYSLAYIGKNFEKQASILLEHIQSQVQDEPLKIAIQVAYLDFDIAKEQIEEIEKNFSTHPGGYEIIDISESYSDKIKSKKEWELVIKEHPEINVAINLASESTPFCVEAIEQYGNENTLIYAVEDNEDTIKLIKEGKITGSVVTSFYEYGFSSVEVLYEYIKNGNVLDVEADIVLLDQYNISLFRGNSYE